MCNHSFFCRIRVEESKIRKIIQCWFVNTKLSSYIVRLAQWKNKMVIFDGIVFLSIVTLVKLTETVFFSDGKRDFACLSKILQGVIVVLTRISLKCNATN